MPLPLSDGERELLNRLCSEGSEKEVLRAQIILMADNHTPADDIAAALSLRPGQVRYWLREWNKRRLDIFPSAAPPPPEPDTRAAEVMLQKERTDSTGAAVAAREAPRLPLELAPTIGILPDDPMAEAGRKVLRFHFERMLLHEPGSRTGENIEEVHDMRVATRRMRSALRLFKPFYEKKAIREFRVQLRRIGTALGEVRDLDVLVEKAQRYVAENPDTDLTPLFEMWQKQIANARRRLIKRLDSPKFAQFVERFAEFLTTPGSGAAPLPDPGEGYLVRHVVPRLIYDLYESVRSYETVFDEADITTLHALRIDFKRLRYALEFFEDVLGPEAKQVIKEIKIMQDHLGDLTDAEVARVTLRGMIDDYTTTYSGTPMFLRPDMSGVFRYAAAKEAERRALLETFPQAWARFSREEVRRDLALAVAAL